MNETLKYYLRDVKKNKIGAPEAVLQIGRKENEYWLAHAEKLD
jgi:hypothetical protein